MKDWEPDHPKAKLMARKRAAILDAARESFLRYGYEGTTMESVASLSGISIMTLYRHARNKDDLFSTVVTVACSEQERTELTRLMDRPLGENLIAAAMMIQKKLLDPTTVALLRTVMAEVVRFPHLAGMIYESLIGHFQAMVEKLLCDHSESRHASTSVRRETAIAFVDRLVGTDTFKALLGLPGASRGEQTHRAELARDDVLGKIEAGHGSPR